MLINKPTLVPPPDRQGVKWLSGGRESFLDPSGMKFHFNLQPLIDQHPGGRRGEPGPGYMYLIIDKQSFIIDD